MSYAISIMLLELQIDTYITQLSLKTTFPTDNSDVMTVSNL